MIEFKVPDMTCGHCASTITKAVKDLDPGAMLDISIADHFVRVDSKVSPEALRQAIAEAGYTPQPV